MSPMSTKKYVNDYEIQTDTDQRGRETNTVVYRGAIFEISLSPEDLSRLRIQSILVFLLITALHVGSGFLRSQGMFRLYVALPYAAAFFPLLYMTEGILRLPRTIRPFRREEMDLSFHRLKITSLLFAGSAAAGVLGQIFFMFFTPPSAHTNADLLHIVFELAAAAASFLLFRLHHAVDIRISSETAIS